MPTDFGQTCKIAVTYGRALAEAFGASLYLLNVLKQPTVPGGTPVGGYFSLAPDYRERMEKDAKQNLEKLLTPADRSKLHTQLFTKWEWRRGDCSSTMERINRQTTRLIDARHGPCRRAP